MAFWAKAFRFAAVFFVLLIGVEVLTCDLPGSDCAVVHASDKHALPDAGSDNCICCCSHAVVVAQVTPVPAAGLVPVFDETVLQVPESRPSVIEQPPKHSW